MNRIQKITGTLSQKIAEIEAELNEIVPEKFAISSIFEDQFVTAKTEVDKIIKSQKSITTRQIDNIIFKIQKELKRAHKRVSEIYGEHTESRQEARINKYYNNFTSRLSIELENYLLNEINNFNKIFLGFANTIIPNLLKAIVNGNDEILKAIESERKEKPQKDIEEILKKNRELEKIITQFYYLLSEKS